MPEHNIIERLRALSAGGVEFILVGGVAAVLRGAPVVTFDVDIVHLRDDENVERLLTVLDSMDAVSRIQPQRRLRPNATHLAGAGHVNLTTRFGPLDVLGTIGDGLGYEELLPHSDPIDIGDGVTVRVLDLPTLIAIKERVGGDKDRAVLPILRRTLELKKETGQ